uniref:Uncharacterized protein n=1 Tax=Compsopogon caeruleus TaxID=31354 RepID=A0A7S1TIJ5_9RHOD|mmetsp:Transcript_8776/g.17766  ORF Transcript_8776/g.17766 Transcript_8776/m.17766 type:complete len:168 (+) Transcript_8776:36-539(+)
MSNEENDTHGVNGSTGDPGWSSLGDGWSLSGWTGIRRSWARREQVLLDRWTPKMVHRWMAFVAVLVCFMTRVLIVKGFYVVVYVFFIFLLNQFLLFVQPKDRSALVADGPSLPLSDSDVRALAHRLNRTTLIVSPRYLLQRSLIRVVGVGSLSRLLTGFPSLLSKPP